MKKYCFSTLQSAEYLMTAAGFVNYSEEWWHYSYGDRLWARTFGKTPIYGLCDEKNVE